MEQDPINTDVNALCEEINNVLKGKSIVVVAESLLLLTHYVVTTVNDASFTEGMITNLYNLIDNLEATQNAD